MHTVDESFKSIIQYLGFVDHLSIFIQDKLHMPISPYISVLSSSFKLYTLAADQNSALSPQVSHRGTDRQLYQYRQTWCDSDAPKYFLF